MFTRTCAPGGRRGALHVALWFALPALLATMVAGCATPAAGRGAGPSTSYALAPTMTPTLPPPPTPTATPLPRSGLIVITRSSNSVSAVDPITNVTLWTYSEVSAVNQFITTGSRVYLLAQSKQGSGLVVALDEQSGAVLWQAGATGWTGNITTAGNRVVVATQNTYAKSATNPTTTTYVVTSAYATSTGAKLWRVWRRYVSAITAIYASATAVVEDEAIVPGSTTIKEQSVTYSAATGNTEVAFDTSFSNLDGSDLIGTANCDEQNGFFIILIGFSTNTCVASQSAFGGGTNWATLIAASGCALVFFIIPTCSGDSSRGAVGVGSGMAYIEGDLSNGQTQDTSQFHEQNIYAVSLSNGGKRWTYTIPGTYATWRLKTTPPLWPNNYGVLGAYGNYVYYSSDSGIVTALDVWTRKPGWSVHTGDQVDFYNTNFTAVGGILFFNTSTEQVGIQISTGKVIWRQSLPA